MSNKQQVIPYYEPNDLEFNNEDFCIIVKLEAEERSRSLYKNTTTKNFFDGTWRVGKVDVNNGENGYLDTSYSDVSLMDIEGGGDKQSICIESIQMKYNSWYMPEITIKFVDVRGNAILNPMEKQRDKGGEGAGSFLKCLFTFPYPKFKLTIKGQYGQAVRHDLLVRDIRTNFNPQTGNFELVANFVGFVYGYMTDISMKYLLIAPYINGYRSGELGKFSTGGEIPTFVEFMNSFTKVFDTIYSDASYKRGIEDQERRNNELIIVDHIIDDISSIESITNGGDTDEYKLISESISDTATRYTFQWLKTEGIERVIALFTTFKERCGKIDNKNILSFNFDDFGKGKEYQNKSFVWDSENANAIERYKITCEENLEKSNLAIKEIMLEAMKKYGTPPPTIKHVIEMILAHSDKFYQEYNYCLKEIEKNRSARDLKNGKLKNYESQTDCKNQDIMPPFPAFYNNKHEYKYFLSDLGYFDEHYFVERILNAAKEFGKSSSKEVIDYDLVALWKNFPLNGIPTLLTDMMYGNYINPYKNIPIKDETKYSPLLKVFFTRMMLWYQYNKKGMSDKWLVNEWPVLEAYNCFNQNYFSDKRNEFLKWAQGYQVASDLTDWYNTYLDSLDNDAYSLKYKDYKWDNSKLKSRPMGMCDPRCSIGKFESDFWVSEYYDDNCDIKFSPLEGCDKLIENCELWLNAQGNGGALNDFKKQRVETEVSEEASGKYVSIYGSSMRTAKGWTYFIFDEGIGNTKNLETLEVINNIRGETTRHIKQNTLVKDCSIGMTPLDIYDARKKIKDIVTVLDTTVSNYIAKPYQGTIWDLLGHGNFVERPTLEKVIDSIYNGRNEKSLCEVIMLGSIIDAHDGERKWGDLNYGILKWYRNVYLSCYNELNNDFLEARKNTNKLISFVEKWFRPISIDLYHGTYSNIRVKDDGEDNTFNKELQGTFNEQIAKFVETIQGLCEKLKVEEDAVVNNYSLDDSNTKLSTYLALKNLYDRHTYGKDISINKSGRMGDKELQIDKFAFFDSLYNTTENYEVDIEKLLELLNDVIRNGEDIDLYSFIYKVCEISNMTMIALPVNVKNLMKVETAKEVLFKPIPYYKHLENLEDGCTFAITYSHKPSERLNLGSDSEYDDDNFDFRTNDLVIKKNSDEFNNISAFGVTYGMAKQRYFQNIQVGMDNPKSTAQSIAATLEIASYGQKNGVHSLGYSSPALFDVYSTNSYTCRVDMPGCAPLMPMMYFQLNNIPMFKGGYIIISVNHEISQGTMKTSFVGVRIAKNTFDINKRSELDCSGFLNYYQGGDDSTEENEEETIMEIPKQEGGNKKKTPQTNKDIEKEKNRVFGKSDIDLSEFNSNVVYDSGTTMILIDAGHYYNTSGKESPEFDVYGNEMVFKDGEIADFNKSATNDEEYGALQGLRTNGNEVIDFNRGGKTDVSQDAAYTKYREYWGARKMANELKKALINEGIDKDRIQFITSNDRKDAKKTYSGGRYMSKVNKMYDNCDGNCILISLHSNAAGNDSEKWYNGANYWSIFVQSPHYMYSENEKRWLNKGGGYMPHMEVSHVLGKSILNKVKEDFPQSDYVPIKNINIHDDLKTFETSEQGIRPITHAKPATILIESLFHTSPEGVRILGNKEYREEIVKTYAKGILDFFDEMKKYQN